VGAEAASILKMVRPSLPYGLYALTDPALLPEPVLAERVAQAIDGGARIVQFRDKSADAAARRRRAQGVLAACRAHGALCIINDDPDLAAELGADGVHLGQDDASATHARAIVGPDKLVGVSCYDRMELALAGIAAGADYVAFGSVWPSATKPGATRASLSLLRDANRKLCVPVVAIGGITRENAAATVAAGAHCIAVVRDLFGHPDPRRAAQVLSQACERGRAGLE
jgi:thiamine-phosphate pyrophosphorylase